VVRELRGRLYMIVYREREGESQMNGLGSVMSNEHE
jgi:hypothetical protein